MKRKRYITPRVLSKCMESFSLLCLSDVKSMDWKRDESGGTFWEETETTGVSDEKYLL